MLKKRTKVIILTAMVLLLGITGYLNITLNNTVIDAGANVTAYNYFDSYRKDRDNIRDQAISYYEAIIASNNYTSEKKALAETKQLALIGEMDSDLSLEYLIKGLGFADVIVTTSTNYINVIIKSEKLTETEVARVVAVVTEQTDYKLANIKIIPVK
ncbi:MAG: SpoIIIAH-like family protein [Clostridia bacterium]|nr:SpoIIIAH-like family protein [Clostridia bacterium]MDD4685710.1 SpoIIIAH-like family protein [Clostridia bacterium]